MPIRTTPTGQALRPADAAQKLGIGVSTLWKKIRTDPDFPQPIAISARITVFMEAELDAYLAACAAKPRMVRQGRIPRRP
jgi:prophage regulatory protein